MENDGIPKLHPFPKFHPNGWDFGKGCDFVVVILCLNFTFYNVNTTSQQITESSNFGEMHCVNQAAIWDY